MDRAWDTNSKYRGLSGAPQRSIGETYSGRVQMNIRDNVQQTPVYGPFCGMALLVSNLKWTIFFIELGCRWLCWLLG